MRRPFNAAPAVVATVILAGCSSELFRYDPETVDTVRDRLPPLTASYVTTTESMDGFRAMEAGDYVSAEAMLGRSLSSQPNDPYALLAMGAVLERTGRPFDASTYYRSAARYGETAPLGRTLVLGGVAATGAKTVRDLALVNIARLEAQ